MGSLTRTDWRIIMRRISAGKLVPIISGEVISHFLPQNKGFVQAWADDILYPLGSSFNVTRLAQYLSVTTGETLAAKEEFLSFSKRYLYKSMPADQGDTETLGPFRDELRHISFAEVAARLGLPHFESDLHNPLGLLARLPLPVYITTSYYGFVEDLLKTTGKKPRTEICFWRDELKAAPDSLENHDRLVVASEILREAFNEGELQDLCFGLGVDFEDLGGPTKSDKIRELVNYLERHGRFADLADVGQRLRPNSDWEKIASDEQDSVFDAASEGLVSVFEHDPVYRPSVQEPLVFHLLGLDTYPPSLVLTEDDFLDLLVRVSWDQEVIPKRVKQALTDSSLLLLGYHLQDWDFRVLFRGLITTKRGSLRSLSLAIQLEPGQDNEAAEDVDSAQTYLEKYFDKANFKIYWGDSQAFMLELWDQWQDQR